MQTMRSPVRVAATLALLATGACKTLDVPDYYAGSLNDLLGGTATVTTVLTAAQGLAIPTRDVSSSFVLTFGEIGREGYSLDPTNPDANAPRLVVPSRVLGAGTWTNGYQGLRQGNVILSAVDAVSGLSAAEKEAVRGWTKTHMAIQLLMIINVFDQAGAAVDVDQPVDAALPPLVGKAVVFQRILQLLDEGKTHLLAGGSAFPFTTSPGFAGFNTPANFLKVNRAVRARVNVYLGNWAAALTDLGESFVSATGAMSLGAYNSYSTLSGDVVNPLYDPLPRTQVALPTILQTAQLRGDGSPDLRASGKTAPMTPRTLNNITVSLKWNIYKAAGDPAPIIKNEELLLLRAEANMQLGNDQAAVDDINVVRTTSGGLDPITLATWQGWTLDERITEVLYNRWYSLIWEGAHRWIDARRYGRLAQLPRARPGDVVFPYSALPDAECIARQNQPASACTPPAGL
jgi:hypothetical protein